MQECFGQNKALFHANRELLDGVAAAIFEPGPFQGAVHGSPVAAPGELEGVGKEFQKLTHAHVLVHSRLIGQVADEAFYLAPLGGHIQAADLSRAAIHWQKRGEESRERGLAGAIRAYQSEKLSCADV